jgi:hypothetical protein
MNVHPAANPGGEIRRQRAMRVAAPAPTAAPTATAAPPFPAPTAKPTVPLAATVEQPAGSLRMGEVLGVGG